MKRASSGVVHKASVVLYFNVLRYFILMDRDVGMYSQIRRGIMHA